ncbi:MAG: DUF952 domain-containing protein [Azospirillaceae bacterium]|nr:DUF952 domain-containing protein [Azospirillaceae bacterium]
MQRLIYHVCRSTEWQESQKGDLYPGSSQDRHDGFIHFSTRDQLAASVAKHRAGQDGLVLLTVDTDALGPALRWEPARGGQLFPHLYGPLPVAAVRSVDPLTRGTDGSHQFPDLKAEVP